MTNQTKNQKSFLARLAELFR